jgi:hypothetical protein
MIAVIFLHSAKEHFVNQFRPKGSFHSARGMVRAATCGSSSILQWGVT